MSKLEEIVPPPDMCKKIPRGYFEDSALIYVLMGEPNGGEGFEQWWELVPRRDKPGEPSLPAPTFDEITEDLKEHTLNIHYNTATNSRFWCVYVDNPDLEEGNMECSAYYKSKVMAALSAWFTFHKLGSEL